MAMQVTVLAAAGDFDGIRSLRTPWIALVRRSGRLFGDLSV
jgi:hypothetical protein